MGGTLAAFHAFLDLEPFVLEVFAIEVEVWFVAVDAGHHVLDASEWRGVYCWCLLRTSRLRAFLLDFSIINLFIY